MKPIALLPALLARVAALQSTGNQYYPAGLFPSWRCKTALGYRRPDSNGFFTSSIAFTLREIRGQLVAETQALADAIVASAVATYPLFENPAGLPLYNFYQTQPRQHFPHGYVLRRTYKFAPPDDVDCTALVYLSDPRPLTQNQWLHARLQAHANTVQGWADTGPPAFRARPIYSAWFGRHMPIDLDASTLSNALLWVTRTGLPLNEFDHGSLDFIAWVITSGEYQRAPLSVSAYYATAPLIAYHAGRLAAEVPALAAVRAALLRDLPPLLAEAGRYSFMERVLLASTLLRLGGAPPPLLDPTWPLAELEARSRGFYFFIAPLLNYHAPTRWLASWRLSQLDWECPAHALVLLAEYVSLAG